MISLSEIRVVELTTDVAGPYAGLLFADFGAEVIKVEDPQINPDRDLPILKASKFVAFNRNKKSVTVDLNREEGKKILFKLLERCDIFIENLDPGIVDALGFSYDQVSERNPKIVYVSIKGYLPGPYGNWPAIDAVIESLSGLTSATGEPEPVLPNIVGLTQGRIPLTGHAPLKLAQPSIPCSAALHAIIGAVGALMNRDRTGKGDKISVGMFESGVSLVEQHISAHALHGTLGKHALNLRRTKDGWAMIRANRWEQFCKSFDVSEEIQQEFASREAREMNQEKLELTVDEIIGKLSSSEVRERLTRHGLDGAALGTIEELIKNEHLTAIGNFVPLTLDSEVSFLDGQQTVMSPMLPIRASDYTAASTKTWTAPPKLGEHTADLLRELGYSNQQIADLQKNRVV